MSFEAGPPPMLARLVVGGVATDGQVTLVTEDYQKFEMPSGLLPDGVTVGNVLEMAVLHSQQRECERDAEVQRLQEDIVRMFPALHIPPSGHLPSSRGPSPVPSHVGGLTHRDDPPGTSGAFGSTYSTQHLMQHLNRGGEREAAREGGGAGGSRLPPSAGGSSRRPRPSPSGSRTLSVAAAAVPRFPVLGGPGGGD
uniref:Uncharacterized protein n=1 Tax=Chromera velia CCMP2878 TaxID=1169474 RepID=A0A0G4F7P2_9ALVE|eukprot:Cvel_15494.t1-p1 / transcript=Cvel_15494.t1 / gene=Cvel_15494 / organism=Chromera_velia_CCMP2878 / gene_product=hypothetical protein / transcript_product=hypothetical protein / location=Cvel_scaffold1149:52491-54216(+) / protein_length=195 / sequence_SO=supercontig / SO=protein_coding / is_pseudo=false